MLHPPNPFVDIEGGLCCTPTVVLAGMWVAENRQGAVTLRSDHETAVLGRSLMPDARSLPRSSEKYSDSISLPNAVDPTRSAKRTVNR